MITLTQQPVSLIVNGHMFWAFIHYQSSAMDILYTLLNPFQFRQILLFIILGFISLILIGFWIADRKR